MNLSIYLIPVKYSKNYTAERIYFTFYDKKVKISTSIRTNQTIYNSLQILISCFALQENHHYGYRLSE